ncbi:MAG: InlB B-repeat-containing protein, partial [Bacteroidaceae bacterium]|nr:InlB B-repeat-containing protein [Bacteroidaceae bacterium]
FHTNTYTINFNGNGATNGASMSALTGVKYDETKTLTQNAFARKHTVTYDYNGGSGSPASEELNYTFKGWEMGTAPAVGVYTSATYSDKQGVTQLTATDNGSVTLYAKWSGAVTLPTPTKTGYTFEGWYTDATNGTKIGNAGASYSPSSNITVYAHWKVNQYKVTLNAKGGTGGTAEVTATYGANMPTATMPTKTGYTFGGYYDGDNGTGTQYYTAAGASARTWNKAEAATLYAKWTANTYKVTLDAKGGTGGTAEVTATYGANMPTATMPTKTGYNFGGYYDGENGTGTQYYTAAGASAKAWNKAETATLYAHWTAKTTMVTLDKQGGTGGDSSVTATYGQAMPTATMPTKTGYDFGGYYTGTEGAGTQYYTDAGASAKNWDITDAAKILYAKWIIHTSTLKVDPNGGTWNTFTTVQSYTQNYNTTLSIPVPTREGYTFDGWTKDNTYGSMSSLTGAATYTFGSGKGTTTTITAKWAINKSSLTVKPNGGMWSNSAADQTFTKDYGTIIDIPKPTRTGYEFAGWTKSTTFNGTLSSTTAAATYTFGKVSDATDTITATWIPISSTVTLDAKGGTGGTASVTATYDAAMPTATMPVKEGYEFGGYYDGENGTGTQYYTAAGASARTWNKAANTTLYAKWTAKKYVVILNQDGGSDGTESVEATFGAAMPAATMPTKTGYAFGGYFTGRNGEGTKYYNADGSSAKNWDKTATVTTLYAYWTPMAYTITFDKQGGTGGTDSTTVTYNANLPNITVPTKKGHHFAGYYTETNGAGTKYYPADGIPGAVIWQVARDTVLYAKWEPNEIILTYIANDYDGQLPAKKTFYYGDSVTTAAALVSECTVTFEYNGADGGDIRANAQATRTWNGWLSGKNGKVYNASTAYTDNFGAGEDGNESVNLIASWSAGAITLPIPTKTGYDFRGWYTDMALSQEAKINPDGKYEANTSTKLYAKWEPHHFKVYYNSNNVAVKEDMPETKAIDITIGAAFTAEQGLISNLIPKADNKVFIGWNTASNGKGTTYYPGTDATSDIVLDLYKAGGSKKDGEVTLYAQWKDISSVEPKSETIVNEKVVYGVENEEYDVFTGLELVNGEWKPVYDHKELKYDVTTYTTYQNAADTYFEKKTKVLTEVNGKTVSEFLGSIESLVTKVTNVEGTLRDIYTDVFENGFTIAYNGGTPIKGIAEGKYTLKDMNLNHYTSETLNKAKTDFQNGQDYLAAEHKITDQNILNGYVKNIAEDFVNKDQARESMEPEYKVYETSAAVKDVLGL